jgi:predicted AlkP superfamily pyrophosphatase or phosphodiesterase
VSSRAQPDTRRGVGYASPIPPGAAVPKYLRYALVLLPTAAFAVFAVLFLVPRWSDRPGEPQPTTPAAPAGRLVVLMVFDQMRGDYPERWKPLFDAGGFARLERDGVWYANAHLPYSCSATGPGHASIGTGLPPSGHGVIENEWFDRKRGGVVLSVTPDRPSPRVPARADGVDFGFAPDQLLADGLGDHLKREKPDSRVYSLAVKDRAAVLMGGKKPDGVYAFDTDVGEFHTAGRYRDTPHAWVAEFNKRGKADQWFGKEWERLKPEGVYAAAVGPDDAPGETRYERLPGGGLSGYGPAFPHPMNIDGQQHPNKRYYERLEASPFGNEVLWQLATACIDGEKLGGDGRTDLVFLGFSSSDLLGHKWGPDSHEALDCTLRTDDLIGRATSWLDEHVGGGRWTLIVTADHGVCPLPERWAKERPDAERFDPRSEFDPVLMGEVLDEKFGKIDGGPRGWLANGVGLLYPHVHLNHAAIEKHGVKVSDVAAALAKWAGNRPHVEQAFTRAELTGNPAADPLTRRCQRGYHPDRGGDVYLVPKAYCLPTGVASLGTSHGTPHPYDTHVPLFAAGAGVPKLGRRDEAVSSLTLGPVVCKVLGITPPAGVEKLPAGW